jgi:hypothetical protein
MDGVTRVPTSLRRAPSGFTDEQIDTKAKAAAARLYREKRGLIVYESDLGDNIVVLAWFRNLAKRRFG